MTEENRETAEELKPCPFCGGSAKIKKLRSPWSGPTSRRSYYYGECQKCLAHLKPEGTEKRAAEMWNRRHE